MVNSKPTTIIYGLTKAENDEFKRLVKEKLAITPNACIVEMIRACI